MPDNIHCPSCGSPQVTANRRGFSGAAALAGDVVFGPIGLLAGTARQNKVMVTCLGCGFQWEAGKQAAAGRNLKRRSAAGRAVRWVLKAVGIFVVGFLAMAAVIALLAWAFG